MLGEGTPQHREETGRATQRCISSPPYAIKTLNGPVKSMLIKTQRQIPAKPDRRRLSSRSRRSKIAEYSPAHLHEALFQAARWHDETLAHPPVKQSMVLLAGLAHVGPKCLAPNYAVEKVEGQEQVERAALVELATTAATEAPRSARGSLAATGKWRLNSPT
jgi:hypothetical protein